MQRESCPFGTLMGSVQIVDLTLYLSSTSLSLFTCMYNSKIMNVSL